jgi:hypothetical protein
MRNRNQKGQSDTSQLISIRRYINKRWHMNFRREWYVGFGKRDGQVRRIVESVTHSEVNDFKWRNPDLLLIHRLRGLIVIEIDGSIHDKKTEATARRNRQYEQANVKLIVINLASVRHGSKTLEEEIDWKMMKLLREGRTGTTSEQVI